MKTYILKYTVYNDIDIPVGSIIQLIQEEFYKFIVVEGELKGKKGNVVDSMDGWLIEDTPEHRQLFVAFTNEANRLKSEMQALEKQWDKIPAAKIIEA